VADLDGIGSSLDNDFGGESLNGRPCNRQIGHITAFSGSDYGVSPATTIVERIDRP
jgi:hypothetical protein